MTNSNLHKAQKEKNDEFYTLLNDIEKELQHYDFKDKVVYCNCDNETSNFVKYFKENKDTLEYKEFYYSGLPQSFDSQESIELLKKCDVVVTNPPFSLFRDFVAKAIDLKKEFLIIGSMNAITYKDCFSLIKSNKMWLGVNSINRFLQPDGSIKKFGNICWFTNIKHNKSNDFLVLTKTYNKEYYPDYDNCNAINVDKVADIPCDFYGAMGVPISFLTKYNKEQFELLDFKDYKFDGVYLDASGAVKPLIDGKQKYQRILIKRRQS